jgi:hypothetical protein
MVASGVSREALPVPVEHEVVADKSAPAPVGVVSTADIATRAKFVDGVHDYIRDNIRLADQKATFFFTGATALLAFLYRNDVSKRWLKPVSDLRLPDIIAFLAMAGLAAGSFLALLVVIPRTKGSRRGYIFWEAIMEFPTGRHYADDLSSLSAPTLVQMKAEHCRELAKVCQSKYDFLRYAWWVCAVGLAASLIVFLFLTSPAVVKTP